MVEPIKMNCPGLTTVHHFVTFDLIPWWSNLNSIFGTLWDGNREAQGTMVRVMSRTCSAWKLKQSAPKWATWPSHCGHSKPVSRIGCGWNWWTPQIHGSTCSTPNINRKCQTRAARNDANSWPRPTLSGSVWFPLKKPQLMNMVYCVVWCSFKFSNRDVLWPWPGSFMRCVRLADWCPRGSPNLMTPLYLCKLLAPKQCDANQNGLLQLGSQQPECQVGSWPIENLNL